MSSGGALHLQSSQAAASVSRPGQASSFCWRSAAWMQQSTRGCGMSAGRRCPQALHVPKSQQHSVLSAPDCPRLLPMTTTSRDALCRGSSRAFTVIVIHGLTTPRHRRRPPPPRPPLADIEYFAVCVSRVHGCASACTDRQLPAGPSRSPAGSESEGTDRLSIRTSPCAGSFSGGVDERAPHPRTLASWQVA